MGAFFCFVAALLLVLAGTASLLPEMTAYQTLDSTRTAIPGTGIRDFGNAPTTTSTGTGNWNTAGTWTNGVPVTGSVVKILNGHTVTYDKGVDTTTNIKYISIESGGTLFFPRTQASQINAQVILVKGGGTLDGGTVASPMPMFGAAFPFTVGLIINFPDIAGSNTDDPSQYGNGLIGLGNVWIWGETKTVGSLVRNDNGTVAGATTFASTIALSGWRVGELLYFPDSRMFFDAGSASSPALNAAATNRERFSVQSIAADNMTVTLGVVGAPATNANFVFDHPGSQPVSPNTGESEFYPHVANETRSVLVQSANPNGNRGIVYLMDGPSASTRANIQIGYTEFRDLGRTDQRIAWNDTTYSADGSTVTSQGTNNSMRGPITMRSLYGPTSSPPALGQFVFKGNEIRSTLSWNATQPTNGFGPALWVDDAHWGYVGYNHCENWYGAGIFLDDSASGTTIPAPYQNIVEYNVCTNIFGSGDRLGTETVGHEGGEGNCFFIGSMWNHVRWNLAAEVGTNSSSATGSGYCYSFDIQLGRNQNAMPIPQNPGDVPGTLAGGLVLMKGPMVEFDNNEGYSGRRGLALWHPGAAGDPVDGISIDWGGTYRFTNNRFWSLTGYSIFLYEGSGYTIDGCTVRGDPNYLKGSLIWFNSDYYVHNFTLTNFDVSGFLFAFETPGCARGKITVSNGKITAPSGITIDEPNSNTQGGTALYDREIYIDNVQFFDPPTGPRTEDFNMQWLYSGGQSSNIVVYRRVFITRYQGDPNANYQVWNTQQVASFPVPATSPFPVVVTSLIANNGTLSAISGETNAVAKANGHRFVYSEIAPATAVSKALWTNALVLQLPGSPVQVQAQRNTFLVSASEWG